MFSLPDSLTPVQQKVLTLVATGSTVTAAAESAGVHRNTVANWRRCSETFRTQWTAAQHDQAMFWRDELQSCADLAIEALVTLLKDPKTPPRVRLRAALAVLDKVSTPPPPEPELKFAAPAPVPAAVPDADPAFVHDVVHNLVQMPNPAQPEPRPADRPAAAAHTLHNSAQPRTTAALRPSRNSQCPCGSGQKFKRCCLEKAAAA